MHTHKHSEDGIYRRWWRSDDDRIEASFETSRRYRFGVGFQIGRNGGESDLGLDLHAGRLGSVWMRLRSPLTKWARVSQDRDPQHWYYARHSGIRLFPHEGCWARIEIEGLDGYWSRDQPWWREISLNPHHVFGRTKCETDELATGQTVVPMPEGDYPATWKQEVRTWTHPHRLGPLLDRIKGVQIRTSTWLDIEGGIPVQGKGENSWDCGMDGLFGCGGETLQDAIDKAVKHTLRDRERYGGPHNLPRAMSVSEAAAHAGQGQ